MCALAGWILAATLGASGIDGPCVIQRLVASDASADARFGSPTRMDGDSMIIGAYLERENGFRAGAAYVFVNVAGAWTEQQKLVASDGAENDFFGRGADIDGDWAAVGAQNHGDRGAVYMFNRDDGIWTEVQKIVPPDPTGWFGVSLVLDGDLMVVQAQLDDDGAPRGGAAYVYRLEDGIWLQRQKVLSPVPETLQYFGHAAHDAGVLAFGAPRADLFGEDAGAVFIFEETDGLWTHIQTLSAREPIPGLGFGVVDIDGDAMVVGAWQGPNDVALAHVFRRDGRVWVEEAWLDLPGDPIGSRLAPCAIDGDRIVCGSLGEGRSGAVYLFERTPEGAWRPVRRVPPSDTDDHIQLGGAVAIQGNTVMGGARQDSEHGPWAGVAYAMAFDDCVACVTDLDDNGEVDIADVLVVLGHWHRSGGHGDVDFDGTVSFSDLLDVLRTWGRCPVR